MPKSEIESVLRELTSIRTELVACEDRTHPTINPVYRDSARNLLHYLALRRHDLRTLQIRLAALGLSSLGRAESHVLASVDLVLQVLHRLLNHTWNPPSNSTTNFAEGQKLLTVHAERLFGATVSGRDVRIMVTMPSEAAREYTLVHDLLQQGMDCMRINCAHDNPTIWKQMIDHLRRAEKSVGRSCKVMMDLGGPKLRTGPLEPGPAVLKIRPQRDIYGNVTASARIWLFDGDNPTPAPSHADTSLPMPRDWLATLRRDDRVTFTDARGSKRKLAIVDVLERGCWAELTQTAYIIPETQFKRTLTKAGNVVDTAKVSHLKPTDNAIVLQKGDLLILTRNLNLGRAATLDSAGQILTPATIGCTIPEVLDDVRAGESIWFDDGKIGGKIESVESDHVLVRVTQTRMGGGKLLADKGINLPETELKLDALTPKDLEDLAFVAEHADAVELSFANTERDVTSLQEHLTRLGKKQPSIILKIETRRGFQNLPAMILAAMRWPSCGVMIARGDLAVESGFERMAEVQEEILWLCEAAHVPVIWATQVLETLAKEGMPSRAEITDAAMAHRAECVMLNKGPHVVSAVRVLDDILRRMQSHQSKKQSMMRELRVAHSLS